MTPVKWHLVVPATTVSGGNRETLRLGADLIAEGAEVNLLSMWKSDNPMPSTLPVVYLSNWRSSKSRALLGFPVLALKFARWVSGHTQTQVGARERFLFTHYTTLPLSLLVPIERRFFFVQDLEWKFVRQRALAALLRRMILYCYRRGTLVSANAYLTGALAQQGISVGLEAPIWADKDFLAPDAGPRDVDFVMVVRPGSHKRLDYYQSFIALARRDGDLRLAAITLDSQLGAALRDSLEVCLIRPSLEQMRALYQRSKCFVHLSDHEGFGLPPLEAMGAGCVPLCRDSGGVRAFMLEEGMSTLLVPANVNVEEIYSRGRKLLADAARLQEYRDRAREIFRKGLSAATRANGRIRSLVG